MSVRLKGPPIGTVKFEEDDGRVSSSRRSWQPLGQQLQLFATGMEWICMKTVCRKLGKTYVTRAWKTRKTGKHVFDCKGRILRPTLRCNFGRGQPTFSWFNEWDPWRCNTRQGQRGQFPRFRREGILLQSPSQNLRHTHPRNYNR